MSRRLITIDGVTKNIKQWAQHFGIKLSVFYDRIERGWDVHRAINQPPQKFHGMMRSPTWQSWKAMIVRCHYDTTDRKYKYYGAKAIGVCNRWRSFSNFLEDMGERPIGKSIDRIDGKKGYEPGNCRWASKSEQMRNKSDNRLATWRGNTKTVAEWSLHTGIKRATLRHRLIHNWPVQKALFTPVKHRSNKNETINSK